MLKACGRKVGIVCAVLSSLVLVIGEAQAKRRGLPVSTIASVGPDAASPMGWVDFCRRNAEECDSQILTPRDIHLTAANFKTLNRVNSFVNRTIEPVSDLDHWGVLDRWDLPYDGKGDCEDFALLKRKILIGQGFPRQALLLTVVKDEHGDGHAVLTVKTDRGEYLLDNMVSQIRPWDRSHYVFVKRQSQSEQNVWVQIGEPTSMPLIVSR